MFASNGSNQRIENQNQMKIQSEALAKQQEDTKEIIHKDVIAS